MTLSEPEYVGCDVLVIGGGGAGLRAAIEARKSGASVLLISKSQVGLGNNSAIAKAAFPAPGLYDVRDSTELHIQDTLKAGCYINEPHLVEHMSRRVVEEVPYLEKFGVSFQKKDDKMVLEPVPGHTYPRHVLGKNRIGTDLTLPLKEYASSIGVRFMEKVFITRLLTQGSSLSVVGVDREGRLIVFSAGAVVLATGGFSRIYRHTTNAVGITGDGVAMAFNLGITLRDMEFVQFYPTAIAGILLFSYEVFIFHYSAVLRNRHGEDIVEKHGLRNTRVMTRDYITQAIMKEILDGSDIEGGVIMDLGPVPDEAILRYRNMLPAKAKSGKREFIVYPTAHHTMGGIAVDKEARTGVSGLFACGEISGGTHGANRLAGNALAELFSMGQVAGQNAALLALEHRPEKPDSSEVLAEKKRLESLLGEDSGNVSELISSLKDVTWYKAGIIRNKAGLEEAIARIQEIRLLAEKVRVPDMKGLRTRLELDYMLLMAELMSRAALERTESRGAHYREDYPNEDPNWRGSIFIKNQGGAITFEKRLAEYQT